MVVFLQQKCGHKVVVCTAKPEPDDESAKRRLNLTCKEIKERVCEYCVRDQA